MGSRWSMTIPERVSLWFAFTVVSLLTRSARCCPSAQWLIGIGGSVTTVAATSAAARLRGRSASRMRSTDCCALLSHVGVRYAHVIGHSFGGPIALQLALEVPQLVHTLTLLEAALMVGDSENCTGREYSRACSATERLALASWPMSSFRCAGRGIGSPWKRCCQERSSRRLPMPRPHSQRMFRQRSTRAFGEAQARNITQPVLVVLGERSVALHPRFAETYHLLLDWFPNAEGFVLPRVTHFLQLENPRDMAGALTDFCARHPLDESAT
jgi:pimeloyl-ACP methyl ester carboxylesterase